MGLMQEFKEFAMKGNVVDMAVGVIIGASFGKIISALVDNVLMPPIGIAMGKVDFKDLAVVIQPETLAPDGKVATAAVAIKYGMFVQTVFDFLIVAFCIFMLVKAMNSLKKAPPPADEAPAPPTKDQELLMEIRDALKARA